MNITKTLSIIILLSIALSCTSHKQASQIEEGQKLNQFFEREFEKGVARYPTWQTYLGRKTNYEKLNNYTLEYANEELLIDKKSLEELHSFNYDILSDADKVSYQIFEYQLKGSIEGHRWNFHQFPLNQMFGYQAGTPAFMINMHRIENLKDAKDYISRLKEIKRVFSERMIFLKKQEKLDIFPPKFIFDKVIDDSNNIISGIPFTKTSKDSTLLEDFKRKINKIKLSSKVKNELIKQTQTVLLSHVKPAYNDLISYSKYLDKKVSQNNGAWSLPDGYDYYNFQLSRITTTDLKADEIHITGLKEVDRIHNEMRKVMKSVNFKGTLKDFFKFMKGGRKAYLKEVDEVVRKMKAALPKIFNTFPKAKLEVKPVEAFREKSAGIAFYNGPSLEGNRPGIYYVNLYKMADNPKYKLEALAYHEAIPGHHMQIAIAKELDGLPTFRKMGGFTAYSEGWGLYAELLPKEIGFYSDPYSDFGRLSMELWRATRLVVDTGIHSKKWSRDKAISYLKNNTPNSELEIMKGIERYFIMPGQATAYKVGMLKILSLRSSAKKILGDKFDLAEFHDIILKDGAVPLFILEKNINLWIKRKMK
jgi:uncharacterized protein (DUF885 family)